MRDLTGDKHYQLDCSMFQLPTRTIAKDVGDWKGYADIERWMA
jgi:hypothetical protein